MVVSKVGHVPVRQLTIVNTSGTPVPQHLEVLLDVSHEDTEPRGAGTGAFAAKLTA